MKRPVTTAPKRPRAASAAVARTPKAAAMRLVRLEFDAARLEMCLSQAEERAATYRSELAQNAEARRLLMDVLTTREPPGATGRRTG